MTTHATAAGKAARPGQAFARWIGAMAHSFRWAMEMQRRCEAERATGRRLDADSLRRIADEVDALVARR